MKMEFISRITRDMKDSITDYQLNKLKESLIMNLEDIDIIIKTDEIKQLNLHLLTKKRMMIILF